MIKSKKSGESGKKGMKKKNATFVHGTRAL
jgi:hypothetical protein